jgi:hypothetical protein
MKRRKNGRRTTIAAKSVRTMRRRLAQAKVAYDTTTASAQTIGHRSHLIGLAMMNPAGLCNPELSTMCSEKLIVANQAVAAMARQSGGIQRIWTEFWFQQMQRCWAAAPQFVGSLTPGRFVQAAAISTGTVLSDWMALGATIAKVSEAMAGAAAKPVRRAAVGNAKRLARLEGVSRRLVA